MDKHLRPCIAEMVGTFFIVFIGAMARCTDGVTHQIGWVGVAVALGLAWSVAVTITMPLSGGHLNPAVTITLWVYKKIEGEKTLLYVLSQLLGALIAGGFVVLIFGKTGDAVGYGTTHINTELYRVTGEGFWAQRQPQLTAIGIEIVLSFLLIFAYFATVVDPRGPKVAGFGVGLMAVAAVLVGGPLVGASMNPARTLGTGLWEGLILGFDRLTRDHFVYWIGPIIGGLLAGGLYLNYIMPEEQAKTETPAKGKN